MNNRKGHADYEPRIPPGWKVVDADRWPVNNADPGESNSYEIGKWKLEVYGEVDSPLELSYDDFLQLPHVTVTLDHHCVDGWSYLGQVWNGVELPELIERAKVRRDGAKYVLVESGEGVSQLFPIERELFLADGQNGAPLSKAAGYPLRVVAPGQFGNRSIKWVRKIKFCKERELDGRERKYVEAGIEDLFLKSMADYDPWTVDNEERKNFLCKLFEHNSELRREKKRKNVMATMLQADDRPLIPLCKVSDLKENSGQKFTVKGREVFLIKTVNGGVRAIEPACSHHGTDLAQGKLNPNAGTIKCPKHGAIFDINNGACLVGSYGCDGGAYPPIRTYKIKIDDNSETIFLERTQPWGDL